MQSIQIKISLIVKQFTNKEKGGDRFWIAVNSLCHKTYYNLDLKEQVEEQNPNQTKTFITVSKINSCIR